MYNLKIMFGVLKADLMHWLVFLERKQEKKAEIN